MFIDENNNYINTIRIRNEGLESLKFRDHSIIDGTGVSFYTFSYSKRVKTYHT